MSWRAACIWSSWALLPMVAILASKGSDLAFLYGAASAVAFAYHWTAEQQWRGTDHALAWACILANCWLAWHGEIYTVAVALIAIGKALVAYRESHSSKRDCYDEYHTYWHFWCGVAGFLLAKGYHA